RILLTEVRGAEAWDFLKITGSGHEGSMTSIHAGSAKEAIDGFITRCYENPQCAQLPYTFMLRKVLDSLDVIVSIDLDGNVRRMNDIYFRPIHRNQYFEEMKA
ncbi:TPA: Flp pilus assembly complex ATPase component TadA, partial [Klebsiella pneumoniae]|nr:Flp pilus assembly complex ATPase component TadA [Klebsiella pneumoniae]